MFARLLVAAALAAASIPAFAEILGKKPEYLDALATGFANEQAVTPRIWVPGLDDGYTPQGLTIFGKYFLVSSYQDADKARPRCRVFKVDKDTGAVAGHFDMPEPCHHNGGIVYVGEGRAVVGDTRQMWRVDLDKAFAAGNADAALHGMVMLPSGWGAAYVFFDGKDFWNGVYAVKKDAADAKIYRMDLGIFDRLDGRSLTREDALEVIPVPTLTQGAAFDRDGGLWISASTSQLGRLYRFDRKAGKVLATYQVVNGIEGLCFDADGRMWGLSEAGARKYMGWPQHFPVIFEIDVAKLK
jgi:hypothetical protein